MFFDEDRGAKCAWCDAQDKKMVPCSKLDGVGRRIVLRTDSETCKREICARYPAMISYAEKTTRTPSNVIAYAAKVMRESSPA